MGFHAHVLQHPHRPLVCGLSGPAGPGVTAAPALSVTALGNAPPFRMLSPQKSPQEGSCQSIPCSSGPLRVMPVPVRCVIPRHCQACPGKGTPWPSAGSGVEKFPEASCFPGTCRIRLGQKLWTARGKAPGDLPLTSQTASLVPPGRHPSR